ncbi:transposase [Desulfohalobiaceae bacterium Ax17]|nr:transposase [Desulfovulcanus ferrireducens]
MRYAFFRRYWVKWLFEGANRYEVAVLNFMVTSNHIHLLLLAPESMDGIPHLMQLVAGRTGQEYNKRKHRKGAFWEKRYHATAVQRDEHLVRCLLYMDLNMCRAKVVNHPGEWKDCGYHEIVKPKQRYKIISRKDLAELLNIGEEILSDQYKLWIDEALRKGSLVRDDIWTTQPAVGNEAYVNEIKSKLGYFVKGLSAKETRECVLKEEPAEYGKECFKEDNTLEWDIFPEL